MKHDKENEERDTKTQGIKFYIHVAMYLMASQTTAFDNVATSFVSLSGGDNFKLRNSPPQSPCLLLLELFFTFFIKPIQKSKQKF